MITLPTPDVLRAFLANILATVAGLAAWTTNKVDDAIVSAMRAILADDEAFALFYDLLKAAAQQDAEQPKSASANDAVAVRATQVADKTGIEIGTILAIVQMVLQIWQTWKK